MTEPSAPAADRPRLFGEAREHLGRALADMMPHVGSQLGRMLEDAAERLTGAEAAHLRAAARALADAVPELARQAPAALNELALRRLEWLASQRAGDPTAATLALYDEAELGEQLALEETASAIRLAAGPQCARLGRVLDELLGRPVGEELAPIGTRVIAAAVVKSMRAHAPLRPYWRTIRQRLPRVLPALARDAIADVLAFLAARGVAAAIDAEADASAARAGASGPPAAASGVAKAAGPPVAAAGERGRAPEAATLDAQPRAHAAAEGVMVAQAPTAGEPPATAAGKKASIAVERGGAIATAATGEGARLGAQGLVAQASMPRTQRLSVLEALRAVLQDAVAFAHQVSEVPYSRGARRRFFESVRARLAERSPHAKAAIPVIDVIGALFDYAIDDARLPEAAKPLMWRLQMPSLMLALLDSQYLSEDRRSVRRLVENLSAIVMAFPDEVAVGSELQRRLETAVRAVEIVASTLYTRASVLAEQTERTFVRGAEQVAMIAERVGNERLALERTPERRNRRDARRRPDRTREREVTERLTALLEERLERYAVPESVREFLRDVWLRHLRTAVLRDGEHSAEYRVALQVVDDLLWTLDSARERQSRRQLVERIPPLIRMLTQGIRSVGAPSGQFKAFFDELFLIHLRKLQRGRGNGGTGSGGAAAGHRHAMRDDEGDGPDHGLGVATARHEGNGEDESVDGAPRLPDASEEDTSLWVEPRLGLTAPAPAPAPAAGPHGRVGESTEQGEGPSEPSASAGGSERRLQQVLASLDLSDFPIDFERRSVGADDAIGSVRRGDWIELRARDGAATYAKVAWINSRRTVILLVRLPDRKALSLRAAELRSRLEQQRAFVLDASG